MANVRKPEEQAGGDRTVKKAKPTLPGTGTRVLMVDNFDSFTHNIVQYLAELGADVTVRRNDAVTAEEILESIKPTHVVISPGPGKPADAGDIIGIVRAVGGKVPLLGVCLGHQAIFEAFGGRVVQSPEIVHGKVSPIKHDAKGVFASLPEGVTVTRYHSLVGDASAVPDALEVSSTCESLTDQAPKGTSIIMGVRHRTLPALEGVQFHPESVLSASGHELLANFLRMSV